MFPPQRDGGTIECDPGSAGATPSVPGNGTERQRDAIREANGVARLTSEIRSQGSGNSSASSPKPGMIAVQPQSGGSELEQLDGERVSGSAPLTKIGPLTGLTLPKSRAATASAVEVRPICSSDASLTCRRIVSPDSISSAGSNELSQA